MVPKIFLTGATGYIGGDALHALHTAHPDWSYTALARNSDKGALIAAQYPSIRLVYGDLSSAELLSSEARAADIILHFASADDEEGARALVAGLLAHGADQPAFMIHTSGTGILLYPDIDKQTYGEASDKIWDDVKDIKALVSLPDRAPHRNVDKIVLGASEGSTTVKTAIVCPPTIYGEGRGPGNQRSIQMPGLAQGFLAKEEAFQVGEGKTYWTNVHVHDLSQAYVLLAEAAASGGSGASWNQEGYYFTENGEHVWGQVSKDMAGKAHKLGFLKSADVKSYTPEEADSVHTGGKWLWGANSRSRASRAREVLGWKPTGVPMTDTINDLLKSESALLKTDGAPKQRV